MVNYVYIVERYNLERSHDWETCWTIACVFTDYETANKIKKQAEAQGGVLNIIKAPIFLPLEIVEKVEKQKNEAKNVEKRI